VLGEFIWMPVLLHRLQDTPGAIAGAAGNPGFALG
jgi:hypothetical protein